MTLGSRQFVRGAAFVLPAGLSLGLGACTTGERFTEAERAETLAEYASPFESAPPQQGGPVEGFEGYYEAGRLIVARQPTAEELVELRQRGVGMVINLRSTAEQAEVAANEYDGREVAETLGMRYVSIPLGGDDGYAPNQVAEFNRAVDGYTGRVLLHCRSGGRARTMWKAYLIRFRGVSPAEAERIAASLGEAPTSLERLLGAPYGG